MRKNKVIYKLIVEDIQNVADETLERELTEEELKKVIDKLGDFIHWFDAIDNTFSYLDIKPAGEK